VAALETDVVVVDVQVALELAFPQADMTFGLDWTIAPADREVIPSQDWESCLDNYRNMDRGG